MKDKYQELKKDVLDEEKAIEETLARLLKVKEQFSQGNKDYVSEPAMGTYLMNFYNGIENIIKRIGKLYYLNLPKGEKMSYRYEIRFSGSGGQGLILAGIIMAEAAGVFDDKHAVQSQSYGPEARGGSSKSEVIISDEPIDYPKATKIDALLALTQEAATKYAGDLKEGGILLIDRDAVKDVPAGNYRVFALPIIETARTEIGKVIVANIVALGAMAALTKMVKREAVEKAVFSRVPKAFLELNKKALDAGFSMIKE